MTVKELLEQLQSFPLEAEVGIDDHGVFYVFAGARRDTQLVWADGKLPLKVKRSVVRLF